MALTEQLPPPPSAWIRSNTGNYLMDTAISRPGISSQYFPSVPFSFAPITTTVPAPQYQPAVPYPTGYHPYSPSVFGSPFRVNHLEQHTRPMSIEPGFNHGPRTSRLAPVYSQGNQHTPIKAEQHASSPTSTTSVVSEPVKIIVPNVPVAGVEAYEYHTPLDNLMKAVQANGTDALEKQPETKHCDEETEEAKPMLQHRQDQVSRLHRGQATTSKQFQCGIAGCNKRFAQKTHLDIHQRAHTGESPYVCNACGKGFTQPGNLKAHWRRHTGEKPFECTLCDKRFPQKGNLQAHMKSHYKTRPFVCMFDNCNKRFSVRGNLKSHQNKFHEESIKRLTARFQTISNWDSVSSENKKMFQYLATLYKNSNKGIKGRGKLQNVTLLSLPNSAGALESAGQFSL